MENASIKIWSSTENGKKSSVITLEGNLTIQNNKEIKEKILDAIAHYDNVKVIMRNVRDIDLNIFQLFYSLKKENNLIELKNFNFQQKESIHTFIDSKGILGVFEIYNN